jgi:hypothetical protein
MLPLISENLCFYKIREGNIVSFCAKFAYGGMEKPCYNSSESDSPGKRANRSKKEKKVKELHR